MADGDLPPGWAWATLGELGVVSGGLTQNRTREAFPFHVPFLRVANVQAGILDLNDVRSIGIDDSEMPRALLQRGDLLFVEGNGSVDQLGRCAIWEGAISQCVHQNHIIKVRLAEEASPRFALHWFSSKGGRNLIEKVASSTSGLHTLSISKIADLEIPLAPIAEQTRIVSEIDGLLEQLDEAEVALARAREGVEQFRASLLHAACTGQLTAAWREANPPTETGADLLRRILAERRAAWERTELARLKGRDDPPRGNAWKARYEEPSAPDLTVLPALPDGWTWASVDQLTNFRGNGLSRAPDGDDGDLAILRISAVRPMRVTVSECRNYRPLVAEKLDGGTALNGDLLFTRYSGSEHFVGVCGLLRSGGPILFPDKVMCARPLPGYEALAPFLEIALNSGASRKHINANIRTTAGQKGIAGSAIRVCPVPLPPISEVTEIVDSYRTLEGARDVPPELNGEGSGALRQSILHAAFTGKLVPQDPDDEPAGALLARLRDTPAPARRTRLRTATEAAA